MSKAFASGILATGALLLGCEGPPEAPMSPTWADVEPILRAQCNHCHGATAAKTGSAGSAIYRLDFFDRGEDVCGEAAAGMVVAASGGGAAKEIKADVSPATGEHPRMPPAPADPLPDWQRDTLVRWADRPIKGPIPPTNRVPRLAVTDLPAIADKRLAFTVRTEDPDGQAVVGILRVGPTTVPLDRSGAYTIALDTTTWPAGSAAVKAVLCDGWTNASFEVGSVTIKH